jgi:anti-anti-sigma factor
VSVHPDPTLRGADGREPTLALSVNADTVSSTIRLVGELDAETGRHFLGAVAGQIAQHHVDLSVDVSDLTFVDLAGFDALRDAQRRLDEHGGKLTIVRYGWLFEQLAEVCGMQHVLDSH